MIGSLKLWNTSTNLRSHRLTTSRTHRKEKKKKESEMMNRKGVEESNENKRHSWRKIQWRPFTYLTSCSLNQGFLCEQEGGSGGAEQDKGLSKLGAKILNEKKRRHGKNFLSFLWVKLVRWFINCLFFRRVLACFLRWGKTEKQKQLQTSFQFPSQYENWK